VDKIKRAVECVWGALLEGAELELQAQARATNKRRRWSIGQKWTRVKQRAESWAEEEEHFVLESAGRKQGRPIGGHSQLERVGRVANKPKPKGGEKTTQLAALLLEATSQLASQKAPNGRGEPSGWAPPTGRLWSARPDFELMTRSVFAPELHKLAPLLR